MQSRVLPKVLVFNILHLVYELFDFKQKKNNICGSNIFNINNNQDTYVSNTTYKIFNPNTNKLNFNPSFEDIVAEYYFERKKQLSCKYINAIDGSKKNCVEYDLIENYESALDSIQDLTLKNRTLSNVLKNGEHQSIFSNQFILETQNKINDNNLELEIWYELKTEATGLLKNQKWFTDRQMYLNSL